MKSLRMVGATLYSLEASVLASIRSGSGNLVESGKADEMRLCSCVQLVGMASASE